MRARRGTGSPDRRTDPIRRGIEEIRGGKRVRCHPELRADDVADGSDYFVACATYPKALAYARRTRGAEDPVALIRQRQYIDEPRAGQYVHVKKVRITEWPVEFLARPRRNRKTIPNFFAPDAPANRLDILRGLSKMKG